MYSFKRLLAVSLACVIIGILITTVAAKSMETIEAEIGPRQENLETPVKILVWTDKAVYSPDEIMTIGIANPLDVRIDFADDTYGLRLERLVDGKWLKFLTIYDPASQETSSLPPKTESSLPSIIESRGQSGTIAITYQLGPDLTEGSYRVVSDGKATLNGTVIHTEGASEFEISISPP